jgi:hypothetical protein
MEGEMTVISRFSGLKNSLYRLAPVAIKNLVAAAALAGVAIALALAPGSAAPSEEQPAFVAAANVNKQEGILYVGYSGQIVTGMADYLREVFGKYAAVSHRVVLFLNSVGGQVEEGERAIHVLREIRQTHRLVTVVLHGRICASMCIPVFLQGQDRFAALASLWIFHEAAKKEANGAEQTDAEETARLFRRYYLPAGVSTEWLKSIVPVIRKANLWQTGGDLISAKTGVIMYPIENRTTRVATGANSAESGETPSAAVRR